MSPKAELLRKKLVKDNVRYFAVGRDRAVYANHSVEDSSWRRITKPGVTDVMVWDRKIYGLKKNRCVVRWVDKSWKPLKVHVPQTMTNLIIRGGSIYGLQRDGRVYKSSLDKTDWRACTPPRVQSFTLFRNDIYAVGMNKHVYRTTERPGDKWHKVTHGAVTQVEVHDNIIYGLGTRGGIYKWEKGWKKIIAGPMTSFAVAGNFIYGVGNDNKVSKYTRDWIKTTERCPGSITLRFGKYSRL